MEYFDDVSNVELKEICLLLSELAKVCPNEYERGIKRAKSDKLVLIKR